MDLFKNSKLQKNLSKQYEEIKKYHANYNKDKNDKAFVQNIATWSKDFKHMLNEEIKKCGKKSESKKPLLYLAMNFNTLQSNCSNYLLEKLEPQKRELSKQVKDVKMELDGILKSTFSPFSRLSFSKVRKVLKLISDELEKIRKDLKNVQKTN